MMFLPIQFVGIRPPYLGWQGIIPRNLEMKRVVAGKIVERLPEAMRHVETYAFEALDIENTLKTKMAQLTVDEYEGLLRPAFQQDEWILIAVGAALGFLVGEMQVHIMLAFATNPL